MRRISMKLHAISYVIHFFVCLGVINTQLQRGGLRMKQEEDSDVNKAGVFKSLLTSSFKFFAVLLLGDLCTAINITA